MCIYLYMKKEVVVVLYKHAENDKTLLAQLKS